ncbi:hypothetical protein AHAS_Ahas17G0253600 [Arachis hypogaea]
MIAFRLQYQHITLDLPTNLNSNSRLNIIILETTNLIGSLTDIFDSFPVLQTFYLSENNLTGVLPQSFSELTRLIRLKPNHPKDNKLSTTNSRYLEMIELNSRRLNGTIPLNINKSPINLCFLDLGNNFLSGPLPSFSGLSYLQSLYLSYNNFTSIPHDCFRGLENFELLELSYNTKLSPWTIPTNLNSNSRLTVIILETTNLIGSLPDIIDSFSVLQTFYHSKKISRECCLSFFSKLTKLIRLKLNHPKDNKTTSPPFLTISGLTVIIHETTNLIGSLPDIFDSFPVLQNFYLSKNNHTRVLPKSFSKLTRLIRLKLNHPKDNKLSVTIPWTFSTNLNTNSRLTVIILETTNLIGSLPIFDSFPVLQTFYLSENNLTGVLPKSFLKLTMLIRLKLNHHKDNKLSENLELLELSYNTKLSPWTFSNNLNSNSRLTVIILETTNLIGSLLDIFDSFPVLKTFYLSENNLKGVLPKSFSKLTRLIRLILNHPKDNKTTSPPFLTIASGTFPTNLNTNSRLTVIILETTNLIDSLSDIFDSFSVLQTFYLSKNNLTRVLPKSFSKLTRLIKLKLNHSKDNKLSEKLELLELSYNTNLSPWTFPTNLNSNSRLTVIILETTNLIGSLPDIFDSFSVLQTFYLSDNNLTGVLPKSFSKITRLIRLKLNHPKDNKLSGTIHFLSSMLQFFEEFIR